MSRLHEPPHPSSPSPRQPALMIGWCELERLLLDRLPPGTVVSGFVRMQPDAEAAT